MKWQHLSEVSAFRKSNPLFDLTISNPERRVSRKIETEKAKKNGNLTWNFIRFGGLFLPASAVQKLEPKSRRDRC